MFSFIGGLLALFRPTLIMEGFSTVFLLISQTKITTKRVISVVLFFSLGLSITAGLNLYRFGALTEFGHGETLAVTTLPQYQLKFSYAYLHTPFLDAEKETLSQIFFKKNRIFPTFKAFDWQSRVIRYRSFNYDTFNAVYFILWMTAIILLVLYVYKRRTLRDSPYPVLCYAWSTCAFFLLFIFYTYSPSINSDYIVDFAPAISIALVGLMLEVIQLLHNKRIISLLMIFILYIACSIWFIRDQINPHIKGPLNLTYQQTITNYDKIYSINKGKEIGGDYTLHNNLSDYKLYSNGVGWDTSSGTTTSIVTFYAKNIKYLELYFTGDKKAFMKYIYPNLALKIGTDYFYPTAITNQHLGNSSTTEVSFQITKKYQGNIVWPVYIKILSLKDFLKVNLNFKLIKIKWNDSI